MAFSQAAAAALQDVSEQLRHYKSEAAALRDDNEALRADFKRYIEKQEEQNDAQATLLAKVSADARQLESVVAELREALSRSESECEALRKERDSMAAGVSDFKGKMEEYGGIVTELEGRVKAAEGELGETQRHAVKLARALHEEKVKSGRAGHLLAQQRKALDSCHEEQQSAGARVSELQQRLATAEEATSIISEQLEAANMAVQTAEERLKLAEARAEKLEDEKALLNTRISELELAHQRTEAQLTAVKARMSERLREQEERIGDRASDAVKNAMDAQDIANREAEAAKEEQRLAQKSLRDCQNEVETLRQAKDAKQVEITSLQRKLGESSGHVKHIEDLLEAEREAHGRCKDALETAEANAASLAELHQGLLDKYVHAIEADKGSPLSPPSLEPSRNGVVSPLKEGFMGVNRSFGSPLSEITHFEPRPHQPRHRQPTSQPPKWNKATWAAIQYAQDAALRGRVALSAEPRANMDSRASMREEVENVIHGLEEELRALDLQYNDMLQKSQEDASDLQGDSAAANWREELAHGTRKVFRAMRRKGEQIARLRQQALLLSPNM